MIPGLSKSSYKQRDGVFLLYSFSRLDIVSSGAEEKTEAELHSDIWQEILAHSDRHEYVGRKLSTVHMFGKAKLMTLKPFISIFPFICL